MNIFETNLKSDFDYMLASMGKKVKINGVEQLALITNTQENHTIRTNTPIPRGALIENYQGSNWLTIERVDSKDNITYRSKIQECNYTLKIILNNSLHQFPVILSTKALGTKETTYFSIVDGKINVTLQNNSDSQKIKLNDRVILMHQAFVVKGVDTSTTGLITLFLDVDSIKSTDNIVDEIADTDKLHSYSIFIDNKETELGVSSTLQLTTICKKDNVIDTSPTLIYSSSDPSKATINSTGTITGIAEGSVTITANYNNKIATINLNIIKAITPPSDNYTITITGKDSIIKTKEATYTAKILNNGIEDTDIAKTCVFTIDDNTNKKATLTTIDGKSCKIKALVDDDEIILTASLSNNVNIKVNKTIILKSALG